MMLYLYVQQNEWIVTTLLVGIALVLLTCLTYQSMWHPRGMEEKSEKIKVTGPGSFMAWLLGFVPWVIILIVVGTTLFTIVTVITKAGSPPNW